MIKRSGKYTVFPTLMGWAALAATDDGVYALVLPRPSREQAEEEILSRVKFSRNPFIPELAGNCFAEAEGKLQKYFQGSVLASGLAIDWSWATVFQKRVLETVRLIPPGSVMTYGEVAQLACLPGSARAVGGALAANLVPIIIPCHRVVGANGKLGGFTGAEIAMKAALIEMERGTLVN